MPDNPVTRWLNNQKLLLAIVFAAGGLFYQTHQAVSALEDIREELQDLRVEVTKQSIQTTALNQRFEDRAKAVDDRLKRIEEAVR